jgi:hypothetical protein
MTFKEGQFLLEIHSGDGKACGSHIEAVKKSNELQGTSKTKVI